MPSNSNISPLGNDAPLPVFTQNMTTRRNAARILSRTARASEIPLIADALWSATALPTDLIAQSFIPYAELLTYRSTGRVGTYLADFSARANATVEQLSADTGEYFCVVENPDRLRGFITEKQLKMQFIVYRAYRESVSARHCYFATPEMSATILAASSDPVDVSMTIDDLPSPTGIAYLHQQDRNRDLILLWAVIDNSPFNSPDALYVQLLNAEGLAYLLTHNGHYSKPGHRWSNGTYLPTTTAEITLSEKETDTAPTLGEASGATYGAYPDAGTDTDRQWASDLRPLYPDRTPLDIYSIFSAFVHMLPQKPVVTTTVEARGTADSTGRRRPRKITYLHYGTTTRKAPATEPKRHYTHRWVVRGHWKRQWYPSQNRHRPIWISTYIAGPADTPIEYTDKVTVLKPEPPN